MPQERNSPIGAVFLDALGTLVELDAPWPAWVELLRERHGVDVSLAAARSAMLAEMAHYRRACVGAADADSLAQLRLECAEILRRQLSPLLDAIDADAVVVVLLDSLRFSAYDDAGPSLVRWQTSGLARIVVSNWDISLYDVLEATGLRGLIDGVVCSAEVGVSKPDPAPFAAALRLTGLAPAEVVHIGDSLEEDVAGARAAGIEPILIRRRQDGAEPAAGVRVIASLREW
jgi:putative hydrolase of the HAD superfamily